MQDAAFSPPLAARLAAIATLLLALSACGEDVSTPMGPDAHSAGGDVSADVQAQAASESTPLGVSLCKTWIGEGTAPDRSWDFEFRVDGGQAQTTTRGYNCSTLGSWPAGTEIEVTEIVPEGFELGQIWLLSRTDRDSDGFPVTEIIRDPASPTATFVVGEIQQVYFKNRDGVVPPGGGEGCTPGFWRQPHHYEFWTDHEPGDLWTDVFDLPAGSEVAASAAGRGNAGAGKGNGNGNGKGQGNAGPGASGGNGNSNAGGGRSTAGPLDAGTTLGEAVQLQGGGANALARHAVAALLNATNPDIDYDLTVAEIVALVNAAMASGDYNGAKDVLEGFNEQGCSVK